jgi:hypothetical protein
MWKYSQRYLEHCLYFDFPVCMLLWLEKIGAKTFRFALVLNYRAMKTRGGEVSYILNLGVREGGSRQLHAPIALQPGNEPPVPTGYEVEWALTLLGIEP